MSHHPRRGRPLIAVALALIGVILGYLIWMDRSGALHHAEITTRSYASVLEARLDATLRRTDSELQRLTAIIPAGSLTREALANHTELNALLKSTVFQFQELSGIGIFDHSGEWVYATSSPVRAGTSIADRAYFRTLRDQPGAGVVFSDALISRTNKRRSIAASRALRDGQGAFRGVVVALIDLESFEKLLAAIDVGSRSALSVYRSDTFMPVVRRPAVPDAGSSTPLPPGTPTREAVAAGRKSGTFEYVAAVDGVRRIYSFQALERYPFYVGVGIATGDALAEWRTRALLAGLSAAALALLIIGLLNKLWRAGAARAQLAAIVENANDAIYSLDLEGNIVSWNAGASRLLGYSACEAIGQPAHFAVPPHHEAGVKEANQRALRGEVVSQESSQITKTGGVIDVLTSRSPVKDGAGATVGVSVILQDITALKRAEQALRVSMERTQGVVASAMDAMVSLDASQRVIVFNQAAENMFGHPAADVIGKPLDRLIPERLRAAHHQHIESFGATHVSTRKMGMLGQISGLHANGREFPIEASISQTGTGAEKVYTVILRDVTARMQAEAARALLETQLREAQKMEAIGTLAGGIAHEFNNALATILGNTELARLDAGDNSRVSESLDEITKASARARDLVGQILAFSRRQATERKVLHLAPLLAECVQLLRATLPARVQIRARCAPDTAPVLADAAQIQQILIHLATYALHRTPDGPAQIGIEVDTVQSDANSAHAPMQTRLREYFEQHPGPAVRLTFSDDGPALDDTALARLFEPFFSVQQAGTGTGLELSAVYGIVQAHDGIILAQSDAGGGARFTIYLPKADSPAHQPDAPAGAAAPAAAAPAAKPLAAPRVLHIDDDPMPLSLYRRFFERRGMHMVTHTDTAQALDALRADPAAFDLVLTDYNMPDRTGLDVARAVRAIRPDLPVAVLSGFIDELLHTQAVDAGVKVLISKSEPVEKVYEAVQQLLRERVKSGLD